MQLITDLFLALFESIAGGKLERCDGAAGCTCGPCEANRLSEGE